VVALIVGQCLARNRSERAVYLTVVIAPRLQRGLNICDDLIGRQIVVGVNRAIIWVVRKGRIVTPGRTPIAGIPKILATADQNDAVVIAVPPTLIVPLASVVLENGVVLTLPVLTALNAIVLLERRALDLRIRRIRKVKVLGFHFPLGVRLHRRHVIVLSVQPVMLALAVQVRRVVRSRARATVLALTDCLRLLTLRRPRFASRFLGSP